MRLALGAAQEGCEYLRAGPPAAGETGMEDERHDAVEIRIIQHDRKKPVSLLGTAIVPDFGGGPEGPINAGLCAIRLRRQPLRQMSELIRTLQRLFDHL